MLELRGPVLGVRQQHPVFQGHRCPCQRPSSRVRYSQFCTLLENAVCYGSSSLPSLPLSELCRYSDTVNFAHSLPEYEPILHIDGARVSQDPLMWVAALDMLLDRMKSAKFPFGAVVAVSGSGQQHGSVYLRKGADAVLASLDPARSVVEQLVAVKKSFFAVPFSPIWMDSSTRAQCEHLEAAMPGGPLQARLSCGHTAFFPRCFLDFLQLCS